MKATTLKNPLSCLTIKMFRSSKILGGVITASLLACGTTPPPIESLKAPGNLVVDLLMQKADRFQRYHLVRDVLWQECGNNKEDSLAPSETHVSLLDDAEKNALVSVLDALLKNSAEETLPAPESDDNDVLTLTLKQDDKSNSFTVSEKTLRGLDSAVAKNTKQVVTYLSQKGEVNCLTPTPTPSSPPPNR